MPSTKPFNEISGVVTELQNALACAARIFELLDEAEQPSDAGNRVLGRAEGNVSLESACFSYVPGQKLIEDFSLKVKPGEKVAIVGPTGCGKTTLINLLMRFYDVTGGAVKVEGEDVREIPRRSLRSNYGMVLQETWLKSGTVRDNIKMGRPSATDEEMYAAAKASHADGFIRRLSEGYDTVLSEEGGSLSQGQKQLLCIARIMLCLPPMLILDEADEMLNMGFLEDMETILSQLPEERQTVMFSATMPHAIAQIAQKFQKDPKMVQVVKKELTVPKVTQYYYEVKPRNKVEVMCRLLDLYSPKLSVAFCNTKKQVDELVQALQGRGYFAEGLHGDLKQEQRDRVMGSFRNGATEILVATDVAARGIDVDDVEAVFNYDIPQDDEYYVHRIGRTGRAGREGRAFSLAVGSEVYKLRDIQRFCKTKIVPQPIPSLDDVTAIKAEKILDDVQQHIGEDSSLERMTDIIEKRLLAEDYTSLELAAAFLKMAMGDDYEDIADEGRPLRDLDDLDRRGGRNDRGRNGRRRQRGDDEEYMDRKNARGGMTRLFINLGKNQNVKPGDILGAIAGESGIPGRLVGSIDMYDKYTFVEVPKEQADIVMDAMNHVKIKGKSVHVEKANRR